MDLIVLLDVAENAGQTVVDDNTRVETED